MKETFLYLFCLYGQFQGGVVACLEDCQSGRQPEVAATPVYKTCSLLEP